MSIASKGFGFIPQRESRITKRVEARWSPPDASGACNRPHTPPFGVFLSFRAQSGVSCSVTLEKKREPFLGKAIFSGADTKKYGKRIGATEQAERLPSFRAVHGLGVSKM